MRHNTKPLVTELKTTQLSGASQLFYQHSLGDIRVLDSLEPPSTNMTSLTPLGICLSLSDKAKKQLIDTPLTSEELSTAIIEEIKERSGILRRRRVPFIDWRLPFDAIDAADATRIMYFLAREFSLDLGSNTCHTLTIEQNQLNAENAALYKGLGFNFLQITPGEHGKFRPERLQTVARIVRDYHFKGYAILIQAPCLSLPPLLELCFDNKSDWPATITLDSLKNEEPCEDFIQFYQLLRGHNYRVIGNDCFIQPKSALATSQNQLRTRHTYLGYNHNNISEILGIGPGAISQWRESYEQNSENLNEYIESPSSRSTQHFNTQQSMARLIYDDLLCFHKLGIDYYLRRYEIDLAAIVLAAWSKIQEQHDKALYNSNEREISLTAEGILHLKPLGDALLKQLVQ